MALKSHQSSGGTFFQKAAPFALIRTGAIGCIYTSVICHAVLDTYSGMTSHSPMPIDFIGTRSNLHDFEKFPTLLWCNFLRLEALCDLSCDFGHIKLHNKLQPIDFNGTPSNLCDFKLQWPNRVLSFFGSSGLSVEVQHTLWRVRARAVQSPISLYGKVAVTLSDPNETVLL